MTYKLHDSVVSSGIFASRNNIRAFSFEVEPISPPSDISFFPRPFLPSIEKDGTISDQFHVDSEFLRGAIFIRDPTQKLA